MERQEYEEREAEIQRKWFETIKKEREEAEKRRQEEEEKKYVDDTLSGKNKPH